MKKRLLRLLGWVITFALIAGIATMPIASANVTVEFLNPFGFGENVAGVNNLPQNQSLTERGSLSGGTILQVRFGRPNDANIIGTITENIATANTMTESTINIPVNTISGITPLELETALQAGYDAVIMGVIDDNMAAFWASYYARRFEANGTPVVVITNEMFTPALENGALKNGFTEMRVVEIDALLYSRISARPVGYSRNTFINTYILPAIQPLVDAALTAPLNALEENPPAITAEMLGVHIPNNTVAGASIATVQRDFYRLSNQLGFGDGLPLVVPTEELVIEMIAAGNRDRDEILGMFVGGGLITVENVAVNAVMAGALPEYFPVILAAMEALATDLEDKNMMFDRAMRSSLQSSIMVVLSGPIGAQLGIISDRSDLGVGPKGSGFEPTATIGRSLRLAYRNIGLNRPEDTAARGGMSRIQDHVLAVTAECTCPLNRPAGSEWAVTHSENMGFAPGSSTVTLVIVNQVRWTGQIGGGLGTFNAGGPTEHLNAAGTTFALPGTNVQTGIVNVLTLDEGQPSIVMLASPHANLFAATPLPSPFETVEGTILERILRPIPRNLNEAVGGRGITSKSDFTDLIVGGNAANRGLVWPIVYGGDWSPTRVFNGGAGIGTNGFHAQLIGGATQMPSAPQAFGVTVNGNNAALSWIAPLRASGSIIYEVSKNGGITWESASSATGHVFSNLPVGEHVFAVRAVNTDARNSAGIGNVGGAFETVFDSSGRGAWAIAQGIVVTSGFNLLEATREELQYLVDKIETLTEEDFTAESWTKLQAAFATTLAILSDDTVGFVELEAVYRNLRKALATLVTLENNDSIIDNGYDGYINGYENGNE